MENPVITLIEGHVKNNGDKIAILYKDQKISYKALYQNVIAYADLLRSAGLTSGDRLAISLPDCPQLIYAFLGGIYSGCISVVMNNALDRELATYILQDNEAKVLFTLDDSGVAKANTPFLNHKFILKDSVPCYETDGGADLGPADYSQDKLGYMLYTSGSTGFPKGVPHLGKNLLPKINTYGSTVLDIRDDDVIFSIPKLFFAYGLINVHTYALGYGIPCVLMPEKPTLPIIEHMVRTYNPTLLFAVPSVHNMIIKEAPGLLKQSRIRLAISAGENISPSLANEFLDSTGIKIIDGYGSTETNHIIIGNCPDNILPGKTGVAVNPWKLRLLDKDGNNVPDGEPGLLWVSGPTVLPYYWKDRDRVEKFIEWYCPDDIFVRDNDVYTYVGRNNDMFKCDGNWVSPVHVEKILMRHPAVKECGVTGEEIMETKRPFAYIVLNNRYKPSLKLENELFVFSRKYMAAPMCPVSYTFCHELPKTETGKIQRFKLSQIDQEV